MHRAPELLGPTLEDIARISQSRAVQSLDAVSSRLQLRGLTCTLVTLLPFLCSWQAATGSRDRASTKCTRPCESPE